MTAATNDEMISITNELAAGIARIDAKGCFISLNQTWAQLLGFNQTDLLSLPFQNFVHPEDRLSLQSLFEALVAGREQSLHEKIRFIHQSGELVWFYLSATRVKSDQPTLIFVVQDISQLVLQQQAAQLAALTVNNSGNGILVTDANDTIIQVNPAFTRISGYSANEIIGRKPFLLRSGEHDESFYNRIWKTLEFEGFWQGEICYRHRSGDLFYVWESISAVTDGQGNLLNYISNMADMSELKRQQQALDELANYDALTQLPNRHYFAANLTQAIEMSKRNHSKVALLFIDLNGFKAINDDYGHKTGDSVLAEIAHRIEKSVRAEDTAARIGGDEFVILVPKANDRDLLQNIAERVLDSICLPIDIKPDVTISLSASIGVSIFPDDLQNLGENTRYLKLSADSEIVELADQAMYAAKEHGLPLCFFDQIHHFAPLARLAIAN